MGGVVLASDFSAFSTFAEPATPVVTGATKSGLPATGFMKPGTEIFETVLLEAIAPSIVPAVQLCVSKDGEIVFNRAYGWINPYIKKPLPTNARIGLASLDKVVTDTAIELLCKKQTPIPGTNQYVSKTLQPFVVFRQLGIAPADGTLRDERLLQVTVENLIKHEGGGLDERVHEGFAVQQQLKLDRLPTPSDGIKFLFYQPLKRAPGTLSEYNSAGYFVLRFLIDLVGGGFVEYLKREVFGPAGTQDICLSRARPADRDPLEARYVCARKGPSIFPEDHGALIPEIEGGYGRYVDNHLVLAASAEAMTHYLSYWFFGAADRLWKDSPGQLAPGLNNGGGGYNGGMVGIATNMEQRRWTMCNYVGLANWVSDRSGASHRDFPTDLHQGMKTVLERMGW